MYTYQEAIENASSTYPQQVTFLLKTSSGVLLRTFCIPVEAAGSFERDIKVLEPGYRADAGEREPLSIIKVERIF